MRNKADIQHNKLMKLVNTMLIYGIYNTETLEKLINTVQEICNVTSSHKGLFAGEFRIDEDMNLVIQFPVFIQPYAQKPLILVPIRNSPCPNIG